MSDLMTRFEADAALRVGSPAKAFQAADALVRRATAASATQIAAPDITRGPPRDRLDQAAPSLATHGIPLCDLRRDGDPAVWADATAGFSR